MGVSQLVQNKIRDLLLGALLSLVVIIPFLYFKTDVFKTQPYSVNVATYTFENNGRDMVIVADFEKLTCEDGFDSLDVFGRYLGQWFLIPWRNTEYNDVAGDRKLGSHTLRITASPIDKAYDTVEIRTRHKCPDDNPDTETIEYRIVDKIFYTFDLTGNL